MIRIETQYPFSITSSFIRGIKLQVCPTSNLAKNCLIEIKHCAHVNAQSTPEGAGFRSTNQRINQDGEINMFISGVVATASLVAILVVLLVGGVALALVDKHFDVNRQH